METVSNVRAAQELDFTGLPEQASAAPPAPSEAAAQPAHLAVELATLAEVGAWIGAVIACGATYDLIKDVLKRAIRRFGPKSLKEIKRHAVEKLKESTETPPADMEAAKKAIDAVFADFE